MSLATELKETARCAYELMARAEAIDRKLAEAGGTERDCELGEIARMRAQISRMTAAAEAEQVEPLSVKYEVLKAYCAGAINVRDALAAALRGVLDYEDGVGRDLTGAAVYEAARAALAKVKA